MSTVGLHSSSKISLAEIITAESGSNREECTLDSIPVLEQVAKPDPIYELHVTRTYLSERPRRASTLTHAEPFKSFANDSFRLENFPLKTHSGSGIQPNVSVDASLTTAPPRLSNQQKQNSIIHFLALCWSIWLVGWNDGTTGPLLPRLQEQYKVGFSVISMVFVGSCFGFICGGALNVWLNDRLGFGKIIVLGAVCQLCGYAFIAPAPPFPLLVCAYIIVGFGISLHSAQANGFVAGLQENMSTKLGVLHGAYGLGAFTSPFASTYFSRFTDHRWAHHFLISGGLALSNVIILIYVFKFRRQEEILSEAGQEPNADTTTQPQASKYKQIFALKAVPLLTIFAVIYIGVEVTLGGWIVTFIIHERDGGHSSGYISSGFFGGLTLGRVGLIWLNKMVGEHRIIIFYSMVAITLELTIWFVPSIIENAVAVSLIGFVLGPMFPLLVSHMTHILPSWLLTGVVGLVTGIGVAGSAALPFITGVLASKYGIGSLQPLMISMMCVMLLVWVCVPKSARRME